MIIHQEIKVLIELDEQEIAFLRELLKGMQGCASKELGAAGEQFRQELLYQLPQGRAM